MLIFHGYKTDKNGIATGDIVQHVYGIGRHTFRPRRSRFVKLHPTSLVDIANGKVLRHDVGVSRVPAADAQDVGLCKPSFVRIVMGGEFEFYKSMRMALHMVRSFRQGGWRWSVAAMAHRHVRRNLIELHSARNATPLWPGGMSASGDATVALALDPLDLLADGGSAPSVGLQFEDYGDDDAFDILHPMAELGHEFIKICSNEINKIVKKEKLRRARRRMPLKAEEISRDGITITKDSGYTVFRGDKILGKLTFPIHWSPPCVSVRCLLHGSDCKCSLHLVSGADELLIDWIIAGEKLDSADDHIDIRPGGAKSPKVGI